MKITGIGSLKVDATMAIVNLQMITENLSLEVAQKENAVNSTSVIDSLYKMGISKKQLRTASYHIEPQYDYVEGKQILRGYRVTNTLSVTLTEVANIGEVIDHAVYSGANGVDNIRFTVDSTAPYYNKALTLAVEDALQKRKQLGYTLSVQVSDIPCKIIEESSFSPLEEVSMLKLSSLQATPILPGQITITAKIEAIFEYKK